MDRADRKEKAAAVAAELAVQSAKIASHSEKQTGQVIDKIAENTQVSVQAFTEANSINAKIAATNAKIAEQGERLDKLISNLPCRDGGLGVVCSARIVQ